MHDIPYRVQSERCGEHNELSRLAFGLLHDLESLVRRARVPIQDKVLNLCKREQSVAVQLPNTLWLADENIHPVSEPMRVLAKVEFVAGHGAPDACGPSEHQCLAVQLFGQPATRDEDQRTR